MCSSLALHNDSEPKHASGSSKKLQESTVILEQNMANFQINTMKIPSLNSMPDTLNPKLNVILQMLLLYISCFMT